MTRIAHLSDLHVLATSTSTWSPWNDIARRRSRKVLRAVAAAKERGATHFVFTGDLTDEDKVTYVQAVIRGKLLESTTLQQQASANSKEQFGESPDLGTALMDAIISALDAHQSMSSQALGSESIRAGMKEILLNQTGLYEELRERAAVSA